MRLVKCAWMCAAIVVLPGMSNATTIYWNLFNSEGNNTSSARYVTYSTLDDMLNDTNRLGPSVAPNGNVAG